ncbi:mechanosensitive ion channel family protein [Foetidibacter luteolus]|uniref:mechanosensitive ion channel family protein n=1 Tax=Foetidibacter luteolus TaxID=2608880 RepID=UPI00129AFE3E|nr:mechanosensitive ion channel domain-containing protein [Foetidibacter luteolus]
MNDFLQRKFLDNTIELYLYVLGSILVALFIKRIISKYLAKVLFRIFSKADKTLYKQPFLDLIIGPLEWVIVLFISVAALDKLTFPQILDFRIYKVTSRMVVDAMANAALVICFIRLCVRITKFVGMILEQKAQASLDQADNQLIVFFKDFFRVILIIIGILLILKFSFHYQISNLLTGLSLVGAAIALALRESLENLIASFVIFFDKPFTTGETVKVSSFTGTVEKIGLRSTRIRTDQKTYITVPNKQMVDTILDNITLRTQRRVDVRLEISLSATAEQLRKLAPAIKMILQHDEIESATVFLSDTGKNAHVITIEYYTGIQQPIAEFNALREVVNLEIIALLNKMDIELAAENTEIVLQQKAVEKQ